MSDAEFTLDQWLANTLEAMREFAATTLGVDDVEVLPQDQAPPSASGGYIAIVGRDLAAQISVSGSAEACRNLAATLLCMEPEEAEDLEAGDIADAIGELVNVVGGMVKTKLAATMGELQLGLPLVIAGQVVRSTAITARSASVRIGADVITIDVLCENKHRLSRAA